MISIEHQRMLLTWQERCDLITAEIDLALAENTLVMMFPPRLPKLGTAAALVILDEDTLATSKQWKRARQWANKRGLNW